MSFESPFHSEPPAHSRWSRRLPVAFAALLAVLALLGTLCFYRYMENTLFQERRANFEEISDKATKLIAAAVHHFRTVSGTAENLLSQQALPQQPEALPQCHSAEPRAGAGAGCCAGL